MISISQKDLFLFNGGRDQERIVRTSYTYEPASDQGLEVGLERAQTIRDGSLRLGLALNGTQSSQHGPILSRNLLPGADPFMLPEAN